MSERHQEYRANYPWIVPLQTRWSDNDVYGHVNNIIYYSYFDTVVNDYLIGQGGLDIFAADVIGLAVETHCEFRSEVAYPQALEAGLRVGQLGRTSVRYEIAIFAPEREPAAAFGHFIHVFCHRRQGNTPTPIPEPLRLALSRIQV